ncbi:MAG TPA: lysoplasmalogenase [Feifaniaceae bacterium]|nr:lysoplasmalogenase [Feifaniaceae bacterium]
MPNFVLACFAVLTAVHLYACAGGMQKLRRFTKPFLMPVLMLWYTLAARTPSAVVAMALLLGCVGDFFLLHDERRKNLYLGIASFAAGHILYLAFLLPRIRLPAWWAVALLAAVYGAGLVWSCLRIRPHAPKGMFAGSALYAALLCCMSACAALYALSGHSPLPFFGSLLFLISDSILSNEIMVKRTRYGTLAVMSAYIAAQFLLALGFSSGI